MRNLFARFKLLIVGILVLLVIGGAAGAYVFFAHAAKASPKYQTPEESDAYVRFDMEAYDKILANYWMKPSDLNLPELYRLALSKTASTTETLPSSDRTGVAKMLGAAFKTATSTDAERNMALMVAQVVLYNMPPAGRDNLLSQKQETALRQEVSNINPTKDLYGDLGLAKGANADDVSKAAAAKTAELAASSSPDAKAELQQVAYAKQVLTNSNSKSLYDQSGIEPTVFPHIIGSTLYLYIDQIAPTTLQEFALAVDNASTTPGITSMILDLRGNIGGALDFLPAFFGLFMGQNQFTFDLYHQGDYQAQRSTEPQFPDLTRYKEIAIETDDMTQSTAEDLTGTFKRFHLAHVVGTHTRGWGTVENTYPMDTVIDPSTTYALLLVNSITLRDDNQPIEGRGVDPDVDTSQSGWQGKLSSYFNSPSLISALRQTAGASPLK